MNLNSNTATIRVLLGGGSPMNERIVKMLRDDRDMEVIGTALDGFAALAQAERLRPDVIVLDVRMPLIDGLEVLRQIRARRRAPVVMLSPLTREGGADAIRALRLGAAGFVTKPSGMLAGEWKWMREELLAHIRSAVGANDASREIKMGSG